MTEEQLIDAVFDAVLVRRSRNAVSDILRRIQIGIQPDRLRRRARVLAALEPEAALALLEIAKQHEANTPEA